VVDGAVLALIKQWLKAPVMGDNDNGQTACVGGGKGNRRGTPQGGVISPLLSNIYLHLMDRIWQRHELARKLQAKLVRYADGLVVLCRKDVATPLSIIRTILGRLDLELNESKTRIVDANSEEFGFLGFDLKMNASAKGVRYPHVNPGDQAVVKVKTRFREITARNRTGIPINDVVRDMNRVLRGWSGYFHFRNSSAVFLKVKRHAEEQLRTHLRKRHKVPDWKSAMIRFPRRALYEKYWLYKLSTVAGWKMAHA
ncbi:MAG: group II intron reverse transcriptase/maturase, partial [Aeromicrobium sp.]|nr:group II intron reverse transcriptase/maturase [Burkholderiales bacterium]